MFIRFEKSRNADGNLMSINIKLATAVTLVGDNSIVFNFDSGEGSFERIEFDNEEDARKAYADLMRDYGRML